VRPIFIQAFGEPILQLLVGEIRMMSRDNVASDSLLARPDLLEERRQFPLAPLSVGADRGIDDRERRGRHDHSDWRRRRCESHGRGRWSD
jgi:hypothetical protein